MKLATHVTPDLVMIDGFVGMEDGTTRSVVPVGRDEKHPIGLYLQRALIFPSLLMTRLGLFVYFVVYKCGSNGC